MSCRRCGQCCSYMLVPLGGVTRANDPQGLAQYFEAHHCKVFDGPECLTIRVPLLCQHLEFDTESGQAFCLIYDQRPQICRDFVCPVIQSPKNG